MKITIFSQSIFFLLVATVYVKCSEGGNSDADTSDHRQPLTVMRTNPNHGATGVPVDVTIFTVFSESVICSTINDGVFFLDNGVTGTIECDSSFVYFYPSRQLERNTTYNATIKAGVMDYHGNILQSDYSWSFTVAPQTWTKRFDSNQWDNGNDIAVDTIGNIFVAGSTNGIFGESTDPRHDDIVVIKVDSLGGTQWIEQTLTDEGDWSESVATDSQGDIIITGTTAGSLEGNAFMGRDDIFVMKYNTDGNVKWIRQMGTVDYDWGEGVAVDEEDNIYVTGATDGYLDGNDHVGHGDVFLIKYSSMGDKQWTRQFGTETDDIGESVAAGGDGYVYITGFTWGSMAPIEGGGDTDVFLAKYDSMGEQIWTRQIGTDSLELGCCVGLDGEGNVYVAGSTGGNLDGNMNLGVTDCFLVKYDPEGDELWTMQFGSDQGDSCEDLTVDKEGNVYVTGSTKGVMQGNVEANIGGIFLIKFNPAGGIYWARQTGSVADDGARGVAADEDGNVYIAGDTEGDIGGYVCNDFGDIFILKFDENGTLQ
jgi:hypothetical protein